MVGVFKEKISDEKDENIYICGWFKIRIGYK